MGEKRELKYLDMKLIEENLVANKRESTILDDTPAVDVLAETILDLLQVADEDAWITDDEIDLALRKVIAYRKKKAESKFRLGHGEPSGD